VNTPPLPNPIVLGIDPGSLNTGYAVLTQNSLGTQILDYGAIRCKSKEDLSDRLLHIIHQLEGILEQHHPTHLCMESVFFAKNAHSALVLGHVRGAIMVLCRKNGMSFSEISPREVKQAITGNGAATKERVARMVSHLLKIDTLAGPLDASDALAIAWTHLGPRLPVQAKPPQAKPRPAAVQASPYKLGGNVATALPPDIDIAKFLSTHGRKSRKRK
jgi:crossover junction endodeoxyribonuclease RuvC